MPTPCYPSHHTSQPYLPGTGVVVNMVVIATKENKKNNWFYELKTFVFSIVVLVPKHKQ